MTCQLLLRYKQRVYKQHHVHELAGLASSTKLCPPCKLHSRFCHLPQSNEWTGKHSFNGQSLHQISSQPNPYEEAASIIARTLAPFDDDNEIPVVGFGDGEHAAAWALQMPAQPHSGHMASCHFQTAMLLSNSHTSNS